MISASIVRLALAVDAIGFGAVLAHPRSTFALSQAYADMAAIASERSWSVFFVSLGIAVLLTRSRPGWTRIATGFLVATIHLFLVISFGRSSGWVSTGEPTHAALAFLTIWLVAEDVRATRRV